MLTYQRSCENLAKREIMKIGFVKKHAVLKREVKSQSAQKR